MEKPYEWAGGAVLEEHSKQKHKILREYFFNYLNVRCQIPQQERFRLAVVDGFSGGGRYLCGTAGSPVIFIEELKHAIQTVNTQRALHNLAPIEIECLLIFNDASPDAINLLKQNVSPVLAEARETEPKLHIQVEYLNLPFESAYPQIKDFLVRGRYKNVLFNLDQCGYSRVERATLLDIMHSYQAEIFYTFAIQSLLAFLAKTNAALLQSQLKFLGLDSTDLSDLEKMMSNQAWLGIAERLVFEAFRDCSAFLSPFSINNPGGWRYWLIHFARSYRARQVYNNILHNNSSAQAHFGRSGLNMLAYDPSHAGGSLYLFDDVGRNEAVDQLHDDIPRLITDSGDAMLVSSFYENIYNSTAAHAEDIHKAIINSPDLQVVTATGGIRRKANTIAVTDVIKLKNQISFFPMFFDTTKKK